jgi:hypothetical protein
MGTHAHGAERRVGEYSRGVAEPRNNTYEPFFGPPNAKIDYDPSDQMAHEALFLPDAYKGRNFYIRDTIINMICNNNAFISFYVLPWKEQDNPEVRWDEITFNKTLLDIQPEQGVPRYVTLEKEQHSDRMIRRGLALYLNHGFQNTPSGYTEYINKLKIIASAAQETCDQAGVIAILRSKNEYVGNVRASIRMATSPYDMFKFELWRWAVVQTTRRGWHILHEEASRAMRADGITPDVWLLPPRMRSFAAYGDPGENEMYRAGEKAARANIDLGADNYVQFHGCKAYEITAYTLGDSRTLDPLNRNRMVGSHYVVPFYDLKKHNAGGMSDLFPVGGDGAIQHYSYDADQFVSGSWEHMNKQSNFYRAYEILGRNYQWAGDREKSVFHGYMRGLWMHHQIDLARTGAESGQLAAEITNDRANVYLPRFIRLQSAQGPVVPPNGEPLLANPAASAIEDAVDECLRARYPTMDAHAHGNCAATWGATVHAATGNESLAYAATRRALVDRATESILAVVDVDSLESAAEYFAPAVDFNDPTSYARLLTDTYLSPTSDTGVFANMIEGCQQLALEHAHTMRANPAGAQAHVSIAATEGTEGIEGTVASCGFDLLVVQPFKRFTMGTAVLLKAGSELGNTFRGWTDFQLADNIIAKTHIGHFTMWHASVVTNAKMMFLCEDVFCNNYLGGGGGKVLSWEHLEAFRRRPLQTMMLHNASLICLPVPVGAMNPSDHRPRINNPLSLTGFLDPTMREASGHTGSGAGVHIGDYVEDGTSRQTLRLLDGLYQSRLKAEYPLGATPADRTRFEYTYPRPLQSEDTGRVTADTGAQFSSIFNELFRFSQMNHESDYEAIGLYEVSGRQINTVTFQGMQHTRDPHNNSWRVTQTNSGHFGPDGIYEGARKICTGRLEPFKEMNYQSATSNGMLSVC